jgi:hypothetical protein
LINRLFLSARCPFWRIATSAHVVSSASPRPSWLWVPAAVLSSSPGILPTICSPGVSTADDASSNGSNGGSCSSIPRLQYAGGCKPACGGRFLPKACPASLQGASYFLFGWKGSHWLQGLLHHNNQTWTCNDPRSHRSPDHRSSASPSCCFC